MLNIGCRDMFILCTNIIRKIPSNFDKPTSKNTHIIRIQCLFLLIDQHFLVGNRVRLPFILYSIHFFTHFLSIRIAFNFRASKACVVNDII